MCGRGVEAWWKLELSTGVFHDMQRMGGRRFGRSFSTVHIGVEHYQMLWKVMSCQERVTGM